MTRIGVAWMPRSAAEGVRLAQAVESAGLWGLGISDSPFLYADLYPVITASLERTSRISVGANVVNPVSRHWTVHSASARAYEELYPGRFHLCVGTGDGSVYSVGLRPAKLREMGDAVAAISAALPPGTGGVRVAASGPKGAEVAGRVGDSVIIGTGTDVDAIRTLGGIAREAHAATGRGSDYEVWAQIPIMVVDEGEVEAARRSIAHLAVAYANFAFAHTFDGKNVPEDYQEPLRSGLDRYSYHHHATVTDENPNAHLFDDTPEVLEYLLDRMTLIDTAEGCADRLLGLIEGTGVDGVNLVVTVAEPVETVRRAGVALAPYLDGSGSITRD